MALFEFEDGHLVPAQFGYPVSHDLGPDLVDRDLPTGPADCVAPAVPGDMAWT